MTEALRVPLEPGPDRDLQPPSRRVESRTQLASVRDDERRCCGRCRSAGVGGEVAEWRVLLVADSRDHRDAAVRDRTDYPFVAEREQILEAAASSGEHDDVDLLVRFECAQRGHDRGRCVCALDACLADDDLRRRETCADGGHEISACRRVCPGEDADGSRNPGQGALPVPGEQPLSGETALELLERHEVLAQPDSLDRRRSQTELTACLVQLRAALYVNGLALLE